MVNLLGSNHLRERLLHTCFSKGEAANHQRLMKSWDGGKFIKWRWGSLVQAARSLLARQELLRKHWNPAAFSFHSDSDQQRQDALGTDAGSIVASGPSGPPGQQRVTAQFVSAISAAVGDPLFWAYGELVLHLGDWLETLSSWCEGCHCHEDHCDATTRCQWKGRRAPELAAESLTGIAKRFADHCSTGCALLASKLPKGQSAQLVADWNVASDAVLTQFQLKLAHWNALPFLLCGLGHHQEEFARAAGRRCLELFEMNKGNPQHRMTLRFLHPDFEGDEPEDLPLRSQLEEFVHGCDLDALPELRQWVWALRSIKVSERQTEACPLLQRWDRSGIVCPVSV